MVGDNVKSYYYSVFLIIGVFIITLLLVFLGIRPLLSNNKKLQGEVVAKRAELSKLEKKKMILENLKKKETEIKNDKEKVKTSLPSDKDLPKLLIQINGLVGGSGMPLKNLSLRESQVSSSETKDKEKASGISDFEATITSSGTYGNFKDFLAKAENALRLVNVNGFSISTSQGDALDLSIDLKTYFRRED